MDTDFDLLDSLSQGGENKITKDNSMPHSIIEILQNDDYLGMYEYLESGGDVNAMINGKPLILHALDLKADDTFYPLLLCWPDVSPLTDIPDWEKLVAVINPEYVEMIKIMSVYGDYSDETMVQDILGNLNATMMGKRIGVPRHSFHYMDPDQIEKRLIVGLYFHEFIIPKFLENYVSEVFDCNNEEAKESAKLATIISAATEEQLGEEFPGLSPMCKFFLDFQEAPLYKIPQVLAELEKTETYVLGIHYSETGILKKVGEHQLDVLSKFGARMLETIMKYKKIEEEQNRPVIFAHTFTFDALVNWDAQVHSWCQDFKNRFGHFPNILLASDASFNRIELIINSSGRENIKGDMGQKPQGDEFVKLTGFQGPGYSLDFCIEESLPLDSIRLIYDSNPDGGLPIPEKDDLMNKSKAS
jgi:hypothetical protein